MSWLNELEINEMLNNVGADKVSSGSYEVVSGVYTVAIKEAYLKKTDSGATMFHLNLEDDNGLKLNYSTCIKSGDAKGNKSTYQNQKGETKLLPGVISVKHLFESVKLDMMKEVPSNKKIKVKKQDGEEVISVGLFKTMTNKKFTACVRQYEDMYNNEIKIKYDIENFLDVNGNNKDGESQIEAFLAKIEKNPIKKLKGSNTPKPTVNTEASITENW